MKTQLWTVSHRPKPASPEVDRRAASKLSICLVDGHLMFREAFTQLMERRGHHVVASVRTPEDLLSMDVSSVLGDLTDVVCVTEMVFGGGARTDTVEVAQSVVPEVPIAVLTGSLDVNLWRGAVASGAGAVALKVESVEEVERVLVKFRNDRLLPPGVGPPLPAVWSRRARIIAANSRRLGQPTQRELDVIRLLAEGHDTVAIATKLGVSNATVRTHLQHLYLKMGVHSRLELLSHAIRAGLLDEVV